MTDAEVVKSQAKTLHQWEALVAFKKRYAEQPRSRSKGLFFGWDEIEQHNFPNQPVKDFTMLPEGAFLVAIEAAIMQMEQRLTALGVDFGPSQAR